MKPLQDSDTSTAVENGLRTELSGGNRQIEPVRTVTRNGTTYPQDTSRIGKKPSATTPKTEPQTDESQRAICRFPIDSSTKTDESQPPPSDSDTWPDSGTPVSLRDIVPSAAARRAAQLVNDDDYSVYETIEDRIEGWARIIEREMGVVTATPQQAEREVNPEREVNHWRGECPTCDHAWHWSQPVPGDDEKSEPDAKHKFCPECGEEEHVMFFVNEEREDRETSPA